MSEDYAEPTEGVVSLMRLYSRLKEEQTGSVSHRKAFWNPRRSRWYWAFRKLYIELNKRQLDAEEYIRWVLRTNKVKQPSPAMLVSEWRYDAFIKWRKKAKVSAVNQAVDYESILGRAEADMQIAVDRWGERGRFYPNYRAFLRAEYAVLPPLFLATDSEFMEVCKSSTGLMADKLDAVMQWVTYLWHHKKLAQDVRKIRDRTLGLATAS